MSVTAEMSVSLSKLLFSASTNPLFDIDLPAISSNLYVPPYLGVTLPVISASIQAQGNYGNLGITLPVIVFKGDVGLVAQLRARLPIPEPELYSGSEFPITLSEIDFLSSGRVGAVGSLEVDLPDIQYVAYSGAGLIQLNPEISSLFTATVGRTGRFVVELPWINFLGDATTQQLAQLSSRFPDIRFSATSKNNTNCDLLVTLTPIRGAIQAYTGETGTFLISLPRISSSLDSYNDLSSDMVVSLSDIRAYFEGSQSGRFDTDTAAKLSNVILKYRRP